MADELKAIDVCKQYIAENKLSMFSISDDKKTARNLYGSFDNCWFIKYSKILGDNPGFLISNETLIISKVDGQILYDGSANDEG